MSQAQVALAVVAILIRHWFIYFQRLCNYFAVQSFHYELRYWWRLFQKRVVRTKFDIYVLIIVSTCLGWWKLSNHLILIICVYTIYFWIFTRLKSIFGHKHEIRIPQVSMLMIRSLYVCLHRHTDRTFVCRWNSWTIKVMPEKVHAYCITHWKRTWRRLVVFVSTILHRCLYLYNNVVLAMTMPI